MGDMFDKGLAIRKEVLGAAHVERSFQNADNFSLPLQELVTTYCWGEVWGRDALPRKVRSMLNIAMLTALNRPHELKLHLSGAMQNGCTLEEIREVLLQRRSIVACRRRSMPSERPRKCCRSPMPARMAQAHSPSVANLRSHGKVR